jgi:hypothetical protein
MASHNVDPSVYAVGASGAVLIFDLRVGKRSYQSKGELSSTHSSSKLPPQVVHVGFLSRFSRTISTGYAPDGTVALWDDRLLSRPVLLPLPADPSGGMTKAATVRHVDVHPIHPGIVAAHTTTSHDIVATEYASSVSRRVAKHSLKQATSVVFHPLSVVFAVGSPKHLVLVSRKTLDKDIVREALTM